MNNFKDSNKELSLYMQALEKRKKIPMFPIIGFIIGLFSLGILAYLLYEHIDNLGPIISLEEPIHSKQSGDSAGDDLAQFSAIKALIGVNTSNTTKDLFGFETLIKAQTDKIPNITANISSIISSISALNFSTLTTAQVQTIIDTMISSLNLTNKTINTVMNAILSNYTVTKSADITNATTSINNHTDSQIATLPTDVSIRNDVMGELGLYGPATIDDVYTQLDAFNVAKVSDVPQNSEIQTDVNTKLISYGVAKTTDVTNLSSNISNSFSNLIQQLPSDGSIQTDVNLKLTSYGVAKTSDFPNLTTNFTQVLGNISNLPTDTSIESIVNGKLVSYGVAKESDLLDDEAIQTDVVAGLESYEAATASDVQGVLDWISNNLPTDASIQSDVVDSIIGQNVSLKSDISGVKSDLEYWMTNNLPSDNSILVDVQNALSTEGLALTTDVSTAKTDILGEIDAQASTILGAMPVNAPSNTDIKTDVNDSIQKNFLDQLASYVIDCSNMPSQLWVDNGQPNMNTISKTCNYFASGFGCWMTRCFKQTGTIQNVSYFNGDGYNVEYAEFHSKIPAGSFSGEYTKLKTVKAWNGIGDSVFASTADIMDAAPNMKSLQIWNGTIGSYLCNNGCNALEFLDLSGVSSIGHGVCQGGCFMLQQLILGSLVLTDFSNFQNLNTVKVANITQDPVDCQVYINTVNMALFYSYLGSTQEVIIANNNQSMVVDCTSNGTCTLEVPISQCS